MNGRKKSILIALGLGAALLFGSPARAQIFGDAPIRPVEILNYLYENGYSRVRMPRLRGDVYVILATDINGRRVRLIVDAYDGYLVGRQVVGRDRARPRYAEEMLDPRDAEDGANYENGDRRSSVEIDTPPAKPKPKRKKVASVPAEESGALVAPGATQPKKPKRAVPEKPAREKQARIAPSERLAPPVSPLRPDLAVEAPVNRGENTKQATSPLPLPLPPAQPRSAPAKLVAPALPPAATTETQETGKETVGSKKKPRVISITPPADLDAPPLPKPPALRATPQVPVVGLD